MPMTVADDVKHELLVMLGSDTVPVEVDGSALDICIKRATEKYSQYKPLTSKESFTVPAGFQHTNLSNDITGIIQVQLVPAINSGILSGLQVENALISGVPVYLGGGDLGFDIDYLTIRRLWLKTVSRQLAADPDYGIVKDPETGIFTLHSYCSSSMFIDVTATKKYNEDLSNIPHYNKYWIVKWALSEVQLILANIRGKFQSVPVAGTQMRLNGDSLRAEAIRTQAELLAELQGSRADLYPRWC